MKNVSVQLCRENQNASFAFNDFLSQIVPLVK